MDKNLDNIIEKVGSQGSYQKSIVFIVFLFWTTIDFLAVSIPYLEINRKVQVYDINLNRNINKTLDYDMCIKKPDFKSFTVEKPGHSWTIEFDIECDKYYVGLIGSSIFSGVLIGSFLFQIIPDLIGRRLTVKISTLIYTMSLLTFCILNKLGMIYANLIINQIFSSLCLLTTFMMALEVVKKEDRSFYGALINSAFSLAGMFYITMYKLLDNWRSNIFIAVTFNIVILSLFYFISIESPRYYIYIGNMKNLYECLLSIAKYNKKEKDFIDFVESPENIEFKELKQFNSCNKDKNIRYIPLTDCEKTNNELSKENKENKIFEYDTFMNKEKQNNLDVDENSIKKASFIDFFFRKSLRSKFLIACYLWFSTSGIYYGLSINIKNLPGDVYTNGILIYFAEIFSYIISGWIIETRLGRKYSMILFECICFFGYLIVYIFQIENYWQTIVSFIARFAISAVYNIIYTYSIEIYPTSLRAKGFGFNSLCARLGGILFPMLIEFFSSQVAIFFLNLNLLAIILILYLPETLGESLKDDIDEND